MLRYLGHGDRHFGLKPLRPSPRVNWEFYAVIEGRCAPWIAGRPKPAPSSLLASRLWVFPPDVRHGWIGERRRCRVVVLHFGSVPAVLAEQVRRHGPLERALTAAEIQRLQGIVTEIQPHYERPTHLSPLHGQKALVDLTLLALTGMPAEPLPTLAGLPQQKVEAALLFYQQHLAERPSLTVVAHAAGVSPSHLRRHFQRSRRETPRRAFQQLALEHAMELLSQTDLTLDVIAERCGFAGASEFSRAFKRELKVPPAVWRAGILPPYQKPVRVRGRFRRETDSHRVVRKLRRYGAHE